MRADDSPATRRMLHIMDAGPGTGPGFLGAAPPPDAGPDAGRDAGRDVGRDDGPRLAIAGRPAQAAALFAVLGLIVCGWFVLRPGPAQQMLPPRPAEASTSAPAIMPAPGIAAPILTPVPGVSAPPGQRSSASGGAPGSLSVYVVGQVRRPGVVTLPPGSRVVDAVDAAGGATSRADLAAVNLARRIADGEQIVIPRHGQVVPGTAGTPAGGVAAGGPPAGAAGGGAGSPGPPGAGPGVINLNAATEAQLDELPGVGPVIAGRIVAWRQENGPFTRVDQLAEIEGIGDATLGRLRPLVTV